MKAYAHLIHYALHTPYNLRQRHYSRLIGSRTTPRQSAAIRESIVSPVANWSPLADDTNTPNVHSPTHELLDAALLRPLCRRPARARARTIG